MVYRAQNCGNVGFSLPILLRYLIILFYHFYYFHCLWWLLKSVVCLQNEFSVTTKSPSFEIISLDRNSCLYGLMSSMFIWQIRTRGPRVLVVRPLEEPVVCWCVSLIVEGFFILARRAELRFVWIQLFAELVHRQ